MIGIAKVTAAVLFRAIGMVESGGDPNAHNVSEDARGIVQIRAIMVEDVNRIIDLNPESTREHFTHDDAYDVQKSYYMWTIYSEHYARHYDDMSIRGIARRWVCGPTGHTKDATLDYAEKVVAAIDTEGDQ